jgi:hypothetical protein
MKGKAEWQQKRLGAAQKNEKSGGLKLKNRVKRKLSLSPCHLLQHPHQPFVQDVERHSMMIGYAAEAV